MSIFFGSLFVLWLLFILVIVIGGSIFWILMLIHAATKDIKDKIVWVLVLVFTHLIGAIIYYFVVKKPFDMGQVSNSSNQGNLNQSAPTQNSSSQSNSAGNNQEHNTSTQNVESQSAPWSELNK